MNRKQKVFERVVNPLLMKYMTDPFGEEVSIAKGIPMKYLPYFQEVSSQPNAKPVRYKFRGSSFGEHYKRPQSFCHKDWAETFAIYHK